MIGSIYPGQTATLTGRVIGKGEVDGTGLVDLDLMVSSEEGPSVPGGATLQLPTG